MPVPYLQTTSVRDTTRQDSDVWSLVRLPQSKTRTGIVHYIGRAWGISSGISRWQWYTWCRTKRWARTNRFWNLLVDACGSCQLRSGRTLAWLSVAPVPCLTDRSAKTDRFWILFVDIGRAWGVSFGISRSQWYTWCRTNRWARTNTFWFLLVNSTLPPNEVIRTLPWWHM